MREKIKDKGRLEHILNAIDGIMSDKELYTLENIKESTLLFHGFTKYVEIIGEAVYIDRLREKSLSGYKNFQFPFWTISNRETICPLAVPNATLRFWKRDVTLNRTQRHGSQ